MDIGLMPKKPVRGNCSKMKIKKDSSIIFGQGSNRTTFDINTGICKLQSSVIKDAIKQRCWIDFQCENLLN